MKNKILTLILLFFLLQNACLSKELYNSKQIQAEQALKQHFDKQVTNIELLPYKIMMLDEFVTMAIAGIDAQNSLGSDVVRLKAKYKNDVKSNNYVYSEKAYFLYLELCKEISNIKQNLYSKSKTLPNKKIILSDKMYDKLDHELVKTIMLLNIFADNI